MDIGNKYNGHEYAGFMEEDMFQTPQSHLKDTELTTGLFAPGTPVASVLEELSSIFLRVTISGGRVAPREFGPTAKWLLLKYYCNIWFGGLPCKTLLMTALVIVILLGWSLPEHLLCMSLLVMPQCL